MEKTSKSTGILRRILRKTGTAFIILAGLLLLTSCGAKEQESDDGEYLYVAELFQTDLPSERYFNRNSFRVTDNYVYYLDDALYRIPIKNGLDFDTREKVVSYKDLLQNQGWQNFDENSSYLYNNILSFTVDDKENLYYCAAFQEEGSVILNKRSEDGSTIYQIPLDPGSSMSEYSSYYSVLAVDNEENAYIVMNNVLQRYDGQGNLTGQLALAESGVDPSLMRKYLIELPDGVIYLFMDSKVDWSRKACKILAGSTPRLENLDSLTGNTFISILYPGLNGLLISETDGWLYQYRDKEQTQEAVLRWEDCDIYENDIRAVAQVTKDLLLLVQSEDSPDGTNTIESMLLLVRTPADEVPKKEQITLASLYPTDDLREAVVKFNKGNEQYHVTIESYGVKSILDDSDAAVIRLDSNLTSKDNTPDLLDFSDLDVMKYVNAGVMEDLNLFIGPESSIRREDYLTNLLEGYTINGKLICIPKAFNFMGALVTDERALAEEDWNIERLMAIADEYEDIRLFPDNWNNPVVMLRLFFSDYILDKFIDREDGKCHLDNEEFCGLLEWVKAQTQQKSDSQNSLLSTKFLNGILQYYKTLQNSEEYFALRGIPTINGKMAFNVTVENALGITANSSHKDGAWAFLEFFLQREPADIDFSDYDYRFPTKITIIDQIMEDITTENTINGFYVENGAVHRYPAMEQSDADALTALLNQIDFTPRDIPEQSIISIILEEAEVFFDGGKTAVQVADIIQNRAQIVLSENQ